MLLLELHVRADSWMYQALGVLDWLPTALIHWFSFAPSAARTYYEVIVFIGCWSLVGVLSGAAWCLVHLRAHIACESR